MTLLFDIQNLYYSLLYMNTSLSAHTNTISILILVLKKDHLITTIIYNFTKLAASIFIAHLLTINSTLRNSKTM